MNCYNYTTKVLGVCFEVTEAVNCRDISVYHDPILQWSTMALSDGIEIETY